LILISSSWCASLTQTLATGSRTRLDLCHSPLIFEARGDLKLGCFLLRCHIVLCTHFPHPTRILAGWVGQCPFRSPRSYIERQACRRTMGTADPIKLLGFCSAIRDQHGCHNNCNKGRCQGENACNHSASGALFACRLHLECRRTFSVFSMRDPA